MDKIVMTGTVSKDCIEIEDGGAAVIVEPQWEVTGGDPFIFVRIQSYDDDIFDNPMYDEGNSRKENFKISHPAIQELFGKKIKVTIEVIPD